MISNLGKFAHPPKGGGRNPGAGRHNAGANPAPGSGISPPNKGGQSEPAGNKPTTGQPGFGKPKTVSTSLNNSIQAAANVSSQPMPFRTVNGPATMPTAGAVMPYGPTTKHTPGLQKSAAPGPKSIPAGPVGGMKPKTLGLTVGVGKPKMKKGAMKAGATKGGHSLLYGD